MKQPRLDPAFPLAQLAANPDNPRRITTAHRAQLRASLQRHGHVGVLVARVLPTGHRLIAGHQRLDELLALGTTHAPTFLVECSDADEQHLALTLNGHAGSWDAERLERYIRRLAAGGDMLDALRLNFNGDKQIADLLRDLDREGRTGLTDPDDLPLADDCPTRTSTGDVWQLGDHRLFVGDSCNAANLTQLMGDDLADLVFTDPPYGVSYEGAAGTIANDDLTGSKLQDFLEQALDVAGSFSHQGAPIYCCHSDGMGLEFRQAARLAGWEIRQSIVWVKQILVLGRQDYQWRHEPILYGWKPGAAHRWYGGRAEDTVWELQPDHLTTVWKIDRPARSPDHPTTKPVELIKRAIVNSSRVGDIVLDSFGGSGSTLIACEVTGRRARLVELSPRYADVILRRWEAHTGGTARKQAP